MCRIHDVDINTFAHVTRPRARRMHRCVECQRAILIGETYEYCRALYDGAWDTTKACQHCVAARRWLEVVCGGSIYGEVLGELLEHREEGFHDPEFDRLIDDMQHRWHDGTDPLPTGVDELARRMLTAVTS